MTGTSETSPGKQACISLLTDESLGFGPQGTDTQIISSRSAAAKTTATTTTRITLRSETPMT